MKKRNCRMTPEEREQQYPLTKGVYYDGGISIMMDFGSFDGSGNLTLGTYDSESRCLEILDEIQAAAAEKTLYHGGVYQMPEK